MIKFTEMDEGNVKTMEFFETVGVVVDYLKANDFTSWQDEEVSYDLTEVETLQDLQFELEKVNLNWWTLTAEEVTLKEAVEAYFENYEVVENKVFNSHFNLSDSDAKRYARDYAKGELYVYDADGFEELLSEKDEIDEYDEEARGKKVIIDDVNTQGYTY